jgi:hypothetical protein
MKTSSRIAKLSALAVLITAAMIYAANRSGASSVEVAGSHAAAAQTEFIPSEISMTTTMVPIGGPELRGYRPTVAERTPLDIHGPFVLATEEVKRSSSERRRRPQRRDDNDPRDSSDEPGKDTNGPPCTNPAKCGGTPGGDGPQKNAETPSTDTTWDSTMPATDPQIAAGPNFLVMSMYNQISFLDKSGKVISQDKNGKSFNGGPIKTIDFFGKLTNDIDSHLNLPAAFSAAKGFGIDTYYDARAIYDNYRQRYWIAALAINNKTPCGQQPAPCNVMQAGARRGKLVVAVSSTSDPRDNWYLYWWDAVPHDGQCSEPICLMTEHGSDYPSIGISEKYFLEENGANSKQYVTLAPADALANGAICNNCNITGGWAFFGIKNPAGADISRMQPAVHHDSGVPNWSFFASNYQSQGQSYHISIVFVDAMKGLYYSTTPIKTYSSPANAPQPPTPPSVLKPFQLKISNVGNDVMKAVFRGGKLYSTFQDCKLWPGASQCVTSIRVVRVDVSNPAVPEIDRTFGQRNVSDPAKVDLVSYATPAVEVNKQGNIALVYMRSGGALFPEARYSVYAPNAPDISPSKALRVGGSNYGGDFNTCVKNNGPDKCPAAIGNMDVGGISVDGSDDEGIWLAHGYVDGNGQMKIAVGRIFGKTKMAGR